MTDNKDKNIVVDFLGFVICAYSIGYTIYDNVFGNDIPGIKNEMIETGYVFPNELEIKCEDWNKDGKDEVRLIYGLNEYLMKIDSQGNPEIQKYKIHGQIIENQTSPSTAPPAIKLK